MSAQALHKVVAESLGHGPTAAVIGNGTLAAVMVVQKVTGKEAGAVRRVTLNTCVAWKAEGMGMQIVGLAVAPAPCSTHSPWTPAFHSVIQTVREGVLFWNGNRFPCAFNALD